MSRTTATAVLAFMETSLLAGLHPTYLEGACVTLAWTAGRVEALMIDLFDNESGQLIGSIGEADLQLLRDVLEEESSADQDYYIDAATIDIIGDGRATDHLLHVLRGALGTREGMDIRWQRR
jgi:processive 1,2-diacylglycerol beta-glucosyltransferase